MIILINKMENNESNIRISGLTCTGCGKKIPHGTADLLCRNCFQKMIDMLDAHIEREKKSRKESLPATCPSCNKNRWW